MVLLMCCENFRSPDLVGSAGYRLCFGVRCYVEQVLEILHEFDSFCVNDRFIGFFFAFNTASKGTIYF